MSRGLFRAGDWVVYRKVKYTTHPGRRAQHIRPAPNGDTYCYCVDKFWVVADVLATGKLLVQTRRGKKHLIDVDDPRLRHATLWDRIRYREYFKLLEPAPVERDGAVIS